MHSKTEQCDYFSNSMAAMGASFSGEGFRETDRRDSVLPWERVDW
jgi:hypothetical protein